MKTTCLSTLCAALCVLALTNLASHAATIASDNATNAAYAGPAWPNASNGGTGFGAWSFATSGGGGRYLGGTGLGATTFGLFAGGTGGNNSSATRPFTGALTAGQTFSIDLGHSSSIANGGEVGLNLLDGGSPVFTLKFVGGGSFWQLNNGGSDFNSTQGYAANTPLSFSFTYNGGSSYSYTFGASSGVNHTATSTISNITAVKVFSNAQGGGENTGANNAAIVPEPASLGLVLMSGIGLLAIRRRRV